MFCVFDFLYFFCRSRKSEGKKAQLPVEKEAQFEFNISQKDRLSHSCVSHPLLSSLPAFLHRNSIITKKKKTFWKF